MTAADFNPLRPRINRPDDLRAVGVSVPSGMPGPRLPRWAWKLIGVLANVLVVAVTATWSLRSSVASRDQALSERIAEIQRVQSVQGEKLNSVTETQQQNHHDLSRQLSELRTALLQRDGR